MEPYTHDIRPDASAKAIVLADLALRTMWALLEPVTGWLQWQSRGDYDPVMLCALNRVGPSSPGNRFLSSSWRTQRSFTSAPDAVSRVVLIVLAKRPRYTPPHSPAE